MFNIIQTNGEREREKRGGREKERESSWGVMETRVPTKVEKGIKNMCLGFDSSLVQESSVRQDSSSWNWLDWKETGFNSPLPLPPSLSLHLYPSLSLVSSFLFQSQSINIFLVLVAAAGKPIRKNMNLFITSKMHKQQNTLCVCVCVSND